MLVQLQDRVCPFETSIYLCKRRLGPAWTDLHSHPYFPTLQGNPECQHQASVTAEDYTTTLAWNPMQISVATEPTFVSNTLSVEM